MINYESGAINVPIIRMKTLLLVRSFLKPDKQLISSCCSLICLLAGTNDHIPKKLLPLTNTEWDQIKNYLDVGNIYTSIQRWKDLLGKGKISKENIEEAQNYIQIWLQICFTTEQEQYFNPAKEIINFVTAVIENYKIQNIDKESDNQDTTTSSNDVDYNFMTNNTNIKNFANLKPLRQQKQEEKVQAPNSIQSNQSKQNGGIKKVPPKKVVQNVKQPIVDVKKYKKEIMTTNKTNINWKQNLRNDDINTKPKKIEDQKSRINRPSRDVQTPNRRRSTQRRSFQSTKQKPLAVQNQIKDSQIKRKRSVTPHANIRQNNSFYDLGNKTQENNSFYDSFSNKTVKQNNSNNVVESHLMQKDNQNIITKQLDYNYDPYSYRYQSFNQYSVIGSDPIGYDQAIETERQRQKEQDEQWEREIEREKQKLTLKQLEIQQEIQQKKLSEFEQSKTNSNYFSLTPNDYNQISDKNSNKRMIQLSPVDFTSNFNSQDLQVEKTMNYDVLQEKQDNYSYQSNSDIHKYNAPPEATAYISTEGKSLLQKYGY